MEAVDRWRDLLAAVDVDDVRELAEMLAGAPLRGSGRSLAQSSTAPSKRCS